MNWSFNAMERWLDGKAHHRFVVTGVSGLRHAIATAVLNGGEISIGVCCAWLYPEAEQISLDRGAPNCIACLACKVTHG